MVDFQGWEYKEMLVKKWCYADYIMPHQYKDWQTKSK